MTTSENFRMLAQAERVSAARTTLPSRRDVHLRAAEAWEEMAERAEDTVAKAEENATANAAAKHIYVDSVRRRTG